MTETYVLALFVVLATASDVFASKLETDTIESHLVPGPVEYDILLPDGYRADGQSYPLVISLVGGGGEKNLSRKKPVYDQLWESGDLPELIVVCATVTPHCCYVDFRDGSQKWESFYLGPFLSHIRQKYNITRDPKKTILIGGSMGAQGALQMGMRHPEAFAAVVAIGGGCMPALKWKDVKRRNRSFLSEQHWKAVFGNPIDEEYWEEYHPATVLATAPERIKKSGLKIYIACGDEDTLLLHEGNEFLHRLLFDHGITHEYHLLRGLPHGGGPTWSIEEPLKFIGRVLRSDFGQPARVLYWTVIREKGGIPGLAGTPDENKRFHDEVVEEMKKRWKGQAKQKPQ